MNWITVVFATAFVLAGCQHMPAGEFGFSFKIPPTAKEAKALRASKPHPVLINGNPVDKKDYPAVVRIFIGSSSCTASVVGPRTILSAAHCAETGEVATFQTVSGKKYQAKMKRAPGYPGEDLDLNLGLTNVDIDVKPVSVRIDRFEKKGMTVNMIGYGCTKPGGGGGNDGVLRAGDSKVADGQGYDLVLKSDGGAALCYGDSGGPVFSEGKQLAVNSKGNIEDTSYVTRTTLPEAAAFLKSWGSPICGVSSSCDGSTPPPSEKDFHFENDKVAVDVKLK